MSVNVEEIFSPSYESLKQVYKALTELCSSGLRVSDEAVTENWLSESLRQLGAIAVHYADVAAVGRGETAIASDGNERQPRNESCQSANY